MLQEKCFLGGGHMELVKLNENLLVGAGGHKKVYIDPRDNKRCIKIILEGKCEDWEREKKYREVRKSRGQHGIMLPEYYGEIATNLGTGYVFERIVDFTGENSKDIGEFLRTAKDVPSPLEIEYLVKRFFYGMLAEKIIVTNAEYCNFLVQRVTPNLNQIRVVDNIGSHSIVPIDCYIDRLAEKHIKRYFVRLLHEIDKDFSHLLPREQFEKIVNFVCNF